MDAKRTVTEALARELIAFGRDGTDAALDRKARLCLTDFLGNALAATELPWVAQARAATAGTTPAEATVIGSGNCRHRDGAAFVNAVAGHALVRDDMHLASVSHLGTVVIPAVLALAEPLRARGRDVIDAIVVGYEAGGRLGRAVMDAEVARIHRPTGTVGPFAAAAAGAKLAGLAETEFAAALGLAANMAAGYNEWAGAGATDMFFHPGIAARDALLAVRLAAAGAVISPTAIEGPAGMLAAFGKRGRASPVPASGGAEILEVFFKEVPACNYAQTAAQAARELASRHRFTGRDIEGVVVRLPGAAVAYPGCDAPGPIATILQAKMSVQYNVAAALLTGTFDEKNFVPRDNPGTCELATRIRLRADDEFTEAYPSRQVAEVVVRSADGGELVCRRDDVAAAADALVRRRFADAAGSRLGARRAASLAALIESLDDLDDSAMLLAECRMQRTNDESRAAS